MGYAIEEKLQNLQIRQFIVQTRYTNIVLVLKLL